MPRTKRESIWSETRGRIIGVIELRHSYTFPDREVEVVNGHGVSVLHMRQSKVVVRAPSVLRYTKSQMQLLVVVSILHTASSNRSP